MRPARAASAPLQGIFALAGGTARVSAAMVIASSGSPTQPWTLDIAMTALGATRPITRYDVELGKRLHVIAVSADLVTFVHEHGERPGADGHFHVPITFPRRGLWHVYADATPAGMGQQVMRFEVDLAGAAPVPPSPALPPSALQSEDGRYAVRFDSLDLRAGQEAMLPLHVLRDGKPAPDLTPFLGVAAHAVFISAADLSYVHAHAAPAEAATGHGMAAMPGMGHAHGAGPMPGTDGAALRPGTRLPPDLVLHLRAPSAGAYRLWVQVMAGGRVRTLPFSVAVT